MLALSLLLALLLRRHTLDSDGVQCHLLEHATTQQHATTLLWSWNSNFFSVMGQELKAEPDSWDFNF